MELVNYKLTIIKLKSKEITVTKINGDRMNNVTTKYKRPTDREHGHTVVYCDGVEVGYFLPNRCKSSRLGENWNFVGKGPLAGQNFFCARRSDVIKTIEDMQ